MSAIKHVPTQDEIKNRPHLADCSAAVEEARREERERCLRILEPFVEPMLVGDEDVDAVAWEVIEEQLLPHPNQTEEG